MTDPSVPPLRTRKPTARPGWPRILVAGVQGAGKSWAAAEFTGWDYLGRSFWLELGETTADEYGAVPGSNYEILDHDGSYGSILGQIRAAKAAPRVDGKPTAIIVDNIGWLWELLCDEQDLAARRRQTRKAQQGGRVKAPTLNDEVQVDPDQWNVARRRWNRVISELRSHDGPVIILTRLDEVTIFDAAGKPTKEKQWKERGEKSLPYAVSAVIHMRTPRGGDDPVLTKIVSVSWPLPDGETRSLPKFTLRRFMERIGFGGAVTGTVPQLVEPDPETGLREIDAEAAAQVVEAARQEPVPQRQQPTQQRPAPQQQQQQARPQSARSRDEVAAEWARAALGQTDPAKLRDARGRAVGNGLGGVDVRAVLDGHAPNAPVLVAKVQGIIARDGIGYTLDALFGALIEVAEARADDPAPARPAAAVEQDQRTADALAAAAVNPVHAAALEELAVHAAIYGLSVDKYAGTIFLGKTADEVEPNVLIPGVTVERRNAIKKAWEQNMRAEAEVLSSIPQGGVQPGVRDAVERARAAARQ